jgi:hypothetical protein
LPLTFSQNLNNSRLITGQMLLYESSDKTILNQDSFFSSYFMQGFCPTCRKKVLAVTFHCRLLNHTNLLNTPRCFLAWETGLFQTIIQCSHISTRLLVTELGRGKVAKQKTGVQIQVVCLSVSLSLSLQFLSGIKQNGQERSCS